MPDVARLAVSNIAWEPHEDDAVAEVLRREGVTGVEIAPTKWRPTPYDAPPRTSPTIVGVGKTADFGSCRSSRCYSAGRISSCSGRRSSRRARRLPPPCDRLRRGARRARAGIRIAEKQIARLARAWRGERNRRDFFRESASTRPLRASRSASRRIPQSTDVIS